MNFHSPQTAWRRLSDRFAYPIHRKYKKSVLKYQLFKAVTVFKPLDALDFFQTKSSKSSYIDSYYNTLVLIVSEVLSVCYFYVFDGQEYFLKKCNSLVTYCCFFIPERYKYNSRDRDSYVNIIRLGISWSCRRKKKKNS